MAVLLFLVSSPVPALETLTAVPDEEPITPIPAPPPVDPLRLALGERLFADPRLSGPQNRACMSCHDTRTNGATAAAHDVSPSGLALPFNTSTVFNAALSFRLNWEGTFRNLEAHSESLLTNPSVMGASITQIVGRLRADPDVVREFVAAYGRSPDRTSLLDALATYVGSLLTPDSRFDRWLTGDPDALTRQEENGYRLFKSFGCTGCHQGVNIGGNLFQRQGIFRALVAGQPEVVRVPSLRNVAVTAPYFHDGSAPTLEAAVRRMAAAQLNRVLTDQQVKDIVVFLGALTGTYRGAPLRAVP